MVEGTEIDVTDTLTDFSIFSSSVTTSPYSSPRLGLERTETDDTIRHIGVMTGVVAVF